MKKLLFIFVFISVFSQVNIQEAKAMDPVTIAILAPYALPVAEAAGQYAIKGLINGAGGMVDVFGSMLNIFRLPLAFLELTVGLPFGFAGDGLSNLVEGGKAPFLLVYHILMLPARAAGL